MTPYTRAMIFHAMRAAIDDAEADRGGYFSGLAAPSYIATLALAQEALKEAERDAKGRE